MSTVPVLQPTFEPHISADRFGEIAPAAYAALLALGKAVDDSGLDKRLTELVKIRASQINGCAFCTQFHLNIARKLQIEPVKLDLAVVWRDVGVFSPRERAALEWTEHLVRMPSAPVPEEAYQDLRRHFSEQEAAHLTIAIANIVAWNRIAGALRFEPVTE